MVLGAGTAPGCFLISQNVQLTDCQISLGAALPGANGQPAGLVTPELLLGSRPLGLAPERQEDWALLVVQH